MQPTMEKKPRKKRATNPSPRQRKAAQKVLENLLSPQPVSLGQVLDEAGYGRVSDQPGRVIESEGFQVALEELGLKKALLAQGISPQKIAQKINVLLEAKDRFKKDDYTAIDKGLKHATAIFGVIQEKPPEGGKTTYNFIFSTEVQQKVREMESEIKSLLTNPNAQTPQENVEPQSEGSRDPQ